MIYSVVVHIITSYSTVSKYSPVIITRPKVTQYPHFTQSITHDTAG